jgi:hypothetical protein
MMIYVNSPVAEWHVRTAGFQTDVKWTYDVQEFIQSSADRTACLELLGDVKPTAVLHVPFPWDRGPGLVFEDTVNQIIDHCDHVAILCSELHETTVDFMLRYSDPKIRYFLCGTAVGVDSTPWMDWFTTSSFFYKNNPAVLSALDPYQPKPKIFDILLGQPKPHRDTVYRYINDNSLRDRVIMTYLNGFNQTIPNSDSDEFIWEDDLELVEKDIKWTVTPVKYHGQDMSLSQVVPIKIYNQTAYTVVCETNFSNHYNFYTEKIVKPILAERLFIVLSGQHYLKNLRSFGFKTFDSIIDETYDTVADNEQRFKLACEQISYLMAQPQEEILAKIRPIAEHNKQVMLTTEWSVDYFKLLREFLLAHTEQN